jgi:hypothetical protein
MPTLPDARQEAFAQSFVARGNATAAYKAAGYKGKGNCAEAGAAQVLRGIKVQNRIAELRERAAQKTLITVEKLTNDLLQIRDLAVRDRQYSAAASALALVAKMHCFLVDRKEVDIVHHKPSRVPLKNVELSEQEWLRLYATHQDQ